LNYPDLVTAFLGVLGEEERGRIRRIAVATNVRWAVTKEVLEGLKGVEEVILVPPSEEWPMRGGERFVFPGEGEDVKGLTPKVGGWIEREKGKWEADGGRSPLRIGLLVVGERVEEGEAEENLVEGVEGLLEWAGRWMPERGRVLDSIR